MKFQQMLYQTERFGEVRVLVKDGRTLFGCSSVAAVLRYNNGQEALKLCKDVVDFVLLPVFPVYGCCRYWIPATDVMALIESAPDRADKAERIAAIWPLISSHKTAQSKNSPQKNYLDYLLSTYHLALLTGAPIPEIEAIEREIHNVLMAVHPQKKALLEVLS